ncbi:hypothetical protein [Paraburkholderia ginsengisoli]|uniref:Uncharacterized protein n=1 Tax=Paraburkholderia ginsengisoli TaxID=311231 RepID=A0A7T4TAR7_9BURK|nr:hypothetical protein [Paraburkholderia ginsengisoli]QQC66064.1 hypothetical protein I6I06_25110 [Paraburkholderia ginsengisoli]
MLDARESVDSDEDGQLTDIDAEAKKWVAALTLTGLLVTLLVIAGLYITATMRDVDHVCFEKKMNDEHSLMEAFFQLSPEQDALVEKMRACSN